MSTPCRTQSTLSLTQIPNYHPITTQSLTKRTYPSIQSLASEPAFNEIIHRFCNYVRMDPRFQRAPFLDVGVHVIRIKADASVPDMRGQVVPEGMHQDGFGEFLLYFEFLFISIWAIRLTSCFVTFRLHRARVRGQRQRESRLEDVRVPGRR